MGEHRENQVQLSTQNPSLSNICIGIAILANLLPEVSYSGFDSPLRVTVKRANANCFRCDVSEKMDALPDEMNVVGAPLIVQPLESLGKLTEQLVSLSEIFWRDRPLLKDTNACNVFTVIDPVFLCEDVSEECRTEANKVDLKFPCLVARINFFCRISRRASKGGWDKRSCHGHSLSMSLPDVTNQDPPVPKF